MVGAGSTAPAPPAGKEKPPRGGGSVTQPPMASVGPPELGGGRGGGKAKSSEHPLPPGTGGLLAPLQAPGKERGPRGFCCKAKSFEGLGKLQSGQCHGKPRRSAPAPGENKIIK